MLGYRLEESILVPLWSCWQCPLKDHSCIFRSVSKCWVCKEEPKAFLDAGKKQRPKCSVKAWVNQDMAERSRGTCKSFLGGWRKVNEQWSRRRPCSRKSRVALVCSECTYFVVPAAYNDETLGVVPRILIIFISTSYLTIIYCLLLSFSVSHIFPAMVWKE